MRLQSDASPECTPSRARAAAGRCACAPALDEVAGVVPAVLPTPVGPVEGISPLPPVAGVADTGGGRVAVCCAAVPTRQEGTKHTKSNHITAAQHC